jgi:hypothetical protein
MTFLKVLAIGGIVYSIGCMIPATGIHYLDIALRGSVVSILYGTLIVVYNVSPEVNVLVQKTIQGLKKQ